MDAQDRAFEEASDRFDPETHEKVVLALVSVVAKELFEEIADAQEHVDHHGGLWQAEIVTLEAWETARRTQVPPAKETYFFRRRRPARGRTRRPAASSRTAGGLPLEAAHDAVDTRRRRGLAGRRDLQAELRRHRRGDGRPA